MRPYGQHTMVDLYLKPKKCTEIPPTLRLFWAFRLLTEYDTNIESWLEKSHGK